MPSTEHTLAWCRDERTRLSRRLEQLQAGRLRIFEKHAQPPGWLELDATAVAIARCRSAISELNAILVEDAASAAPVAVPAAAVEPLRVDLPRPAPPVPPALVPGEVHGQEHGYLPHDLRHPDWVHGWGIVKGEPPNWQFIGIYESHAEADAAAAEAGAGYYARWGSYNERSREFISGPQRPL